MLYLFYVDILCLTMWMNSSASTGHPLKCKGTWRVSSLHIEPSLWNLGEGRWGQKNIQKNPKMNSYFPFIFVEKIWILFNSIWEEFEKILVWWIVYFHKTFTGSFEVTFYKFKAQFNKSVTRLRGQQFIEY